MNPTKTGLYSTNVGDRFILLYWDGEDWVDQDGIRPRYKEVHWKGKPLFVPALRTWIGLTDEEIENAISDGFARGLDDGNVSNRFVIQYVRVIEAALRSKNT
jgi:hypothetical protein